MQPQQHPSPVAEATPLPHCPMFRAAIHTVQPAAGRGRPQAEPIPEAEETWKPSQEEVCPSSDSAFPDLGPRGPDLASLQAERDVVSEAGRGPGAGLTIGVNLLSGGRAWSWDLGQTSGDVATGDRMGQGQASEGVAWPKCAPVLSVCGTVDVGRGGMRV